MTSQNPAADPGASGYPMPDLKYVETQGNPSDQADYYIENIDSMMRDAYDKHIERVGNNIYPILYVDFTLTGGRYNLVIDKETMISRAPDLRGYAQLKSVAHVPLGIFVRISEFFTYPDNQQWVAPLTEYRAALTKAREHLPDSCLNGFAESACDQILTAAVNYINAAISTGRVDYTGFQTFTREISTPINFCMGSAASQQVQAMGSIVTEFKNKLADKWDDVYVVISALWPLSKENVHELIIGSQMTEERKRTNLIVSEGVESLDDAKLLLGRIIGDRIAGHAVFTGNGALEHTEKENIFSLSTQRDLLSQGAIAALNNHNNGMEHSPELLEQMKKLCPHAVL